MSPSNLPPLIVHCLLRRHFMWMNVGDIADKLVIVRHRFLLQEVR